MKIFKSLALFLFLFFCVTLNVHGQKKPLSVKSTYSIKGFIEDYPEGQIYLAYYSGSKKKGVTDTAIVKDNRFILKGALNEPVIAFVKLNNKNQTYVFIEPGAMSITLKLNEFQNARLTGSKAQDLYVALEAKKSAIRGKYANILSAYKSEADPAKKDTLKAQLNPYYLESRQADLSFFDKYPSSVITGFLIANGYVNKLSSDLLEHYYKQMKGGEGIMAIYKKQIADGIEMIKRNEMGKKAMDFKTIDINNDSISLSQFKGKYVLLDFWATWCVPCREKTPHMIDLYNQYKSKDFVIIGIADDDYRLDAWKKAVKEDKLPWINILRGQDKEKASRSIPNKNDLSELFGVHVLPTLILLDKDGKIIDRFIGNDKIENERMDRKISSLLDK
ncbi:TlpA disulfide reductase family protein [Pedobacter sp. ASV28]|uniref:TlpA disulfide reductase family protein n=1 Tax=Pedobacter sp. ASV28 TaxID=2795123 RepID=UPI0018EB1402|nr:TlpA disulfide reductase family protein [Pedobacter sp. ASV28]